MFSSSLSAVRTGLLGMLTIILAATLIILVPELEAESGADVDQDQPEGLVQAIVPSFEAPSVRSGLVDFELTDDIEHVVERGETLIHIARKYQVEYQVIADYNALRNPNSISVGQLIRIPGSASRPLP
jgi:nucleoid-associated protein YgaU